MIIDDNTKKCMEMMVERLIPLTQNRMEEAYRNKQEVYAVYTVETLEGEKIPVIEKNDCLWTLNSRYCAQKAAQDWAKQFDEMRVNDSSIILIFGLGDGRAILELVQHTNCDKIIIYEPCEDIFWEVSKYPEIVELLTFSNVCLIVNGINEEYYSHILDNILTYSNFQLVIQASLPNYECLFADEYKKILKKYKDSVELIIFTRNTMILRGLESQRNVYTLMSDMINGYSIIQLKDIAKKKGMEKVPAILVAAGPSLDKNVMELVNAKGKAFLMVLDTALNTVLERGIIPDMTMSIDSRKPLTLFKNEKFKEIPIALTMQSNQKVVEINNAKHFYEIDEESYVAQYIYEVGKGAKQLPTGGSVANNALSLLIDMGFQTIVLVGQDLAYPGGMEHTKAAYNSESDKVNFEKKEYFEVEDIYGNTVLTEANMNIYRKWMENYIAANEKVRVIDATEGGAKIAGTEIRILREVIDEICTTEVKVEEILECGEPYFTYGEQKKLVDKIKSLPEEIKWLEKKINEGLELYRRIEKINRNEAELMLKVMNEITETNRDIEDSAVSKMLRPYMAQISYEVEGEVLLYNDKDSMMKQVEELVIQGEKLYRGYLEGIKALQLDLPLILEKF